MFCPSCHAENDDQAEACFTCGRALYALTQGILLAQRYEILSPLGSGGMGRVYKAHDRALDEYVAIKVLRSELTREPEMARRFRSEIKLARMVSHRNVCRIHEYGEDGGLAFICMEYVEGKNVREFLSERSLAPEEALDLAIQVAEGLQAVHEHGIVHRDFKASNSGSRSPRTPRARA
jgi:serine/threonine-protein kinase